MKVIVRWTAVFETEIEVPDDATDLHQACCDEAAAIDLDGIENTEYQQDTWEVENFKDEYGNLIY